ncbi:MAG: aromatic ring-hydroxylating dioxygenase subunit alpha, partial [Sphingomonadales bacterium]|nr:aromatic ring-hydroxylating dioxygenase subunit alpha [Sphingomonadales bacterium]
MNLETGVMAVPDDKFGLGTDPIPASAYHDADWFEAERRAIFMKVWINVGHVCELPENGSF